MLSFSAKTVTKELLADLPERSRRVLTDRFGLSNKGVSRTLDAIGQEYGITRERIRQIENHGLTTVRESGVYVSHGATWDDLKRAIFALGGAVAEETVLAELAKNES